MRFGLLGPVTIAQDGAYASISRSQRRGLLGYLLLNHGRWVSADMITEALWGGAEPASARQQIQTSVHAIRSELRKLGSDEMLEGGGSGYRLELAEHEFDLSEFVDLIEAARLANHRTEFERSEAHLVEALDRWRGAALADASGAYVESARAGLDERRLSATEDLFAVRLALGRHTEVLAAVGPMLLTNPLRERLRGQQMLALYREGRQVEALEAFRTFRDLLVDEHGLDPHPDLQALERAILTGDPALDRPADRGPVQEVAAVTAPRRPADRSDVPVPAQLPAAASAFVGRVVELEKLDRALAAGRAESGRPPAVVVSTLDGAGGVGKTATAVTWAHRIKDEYPDGQLYVNMHGYSTMPAVAPLSALGQLLDALGVPPEHVPVEVDAAASLYRTRLAGRRLLILIDNVNDVDQVRPLLPGHAGCLTLITSRAPLTGLIAREGARRVSLGGLNPAESLSLLARILGAERVEAEPAAAAEIAQACAHLPLALRIVAANLDERPRTTLAEYAVLLKKAGSLDVLEVDGDPQASVRVALAQSYGALRPDLQRVFRLLALVPGADATPSMVAALADRPVKRIVAALERLASSHLLDEVAPGRYAMHDLVRFFAQERAASEESTPDREHAVHRLFGFYVASLDRVARRLYPQVLRLTPQPVAGVVPDEPADAGAAVAWAEANRVNMVAAVLWAAAEGPARPAAELADALRGVFMVRRHMSQWWAVGRAGLAAAARLGDDRLTAAAELSLGMACRSEANYPLAVEHLDRALAASRAAGWAEAEASALGSVAVVHGELCEFAPAMQRLSEALEINRRIGRRAGEAVTLGNLASFRMRAGDMPGALTDSIEALALYREVGSPGGEALILSNLSAISYHLGNFADGLAYAEDALAIQEHIGDQSGAALALLAQGLIRYERGELITARQVVDRALELARASQDLTREPDALVARASLRLSTGDLDGALEDGLRAAELGNAVAASTPESEAYVIVSRVLLAQGRVDDAVGAAEQALALARRQGLLVNIGLGLTALARAEAVRGNLVPAREYVHEAIVAHRACRTRPDEGRALVVLAEIEEAEGRVEAAVRVRTEAWTLFREMGSPLADEVRALLPD